MSTPSLLPHELDVEGLALYSLIVGADQTLLIRHVAEVVRRAGVVDVAQLDENEKAAVLTPPLGARDLDRTRVQIIGIEPAAGLRAPNLQDIAAVRANPAADQPLGAHLLRLRL